ncbi:MAG TPA: dihydroorotate dehydrogenase-like protein [Candidatus Competibacter sp.]|jgi:dihydroorotate dehydrogenase (fumarate)|nr:dihydroorotate dehydrogenase-like protein [Candidatus Competibacter sp.]HRF62857.1 dihydroorotate dehydrogenase-like protein [Candidatus Competibacter sp.]HRX62213.1 dihydroorotate dehydrogenase-like protein [Candidatus Competibacter sp.]HUM91337.1 dihydroorotate dehydrogenase-like protein [Candidatus Competibacter sp.]
MDLRTTYMGMELKHPIVASASPLAGTVANIKRLEDAGASAVVMFSLFEEQLKHESAALEYLMTAHTESFAESLNYFPEVDDYTVGPDSYLDILRRASEAVDIPIMGSLNGITNAGWIEYAQLMQQAGAKGIELNIYYIPADLTTSGREVEERYIEIVKAVKAAVTVPVAVKLNPFFSAIGSMIRALDDAGADALVLFNRFYQPDFDLDKLEVAPNLNLSSPDEIRLPLLWIAILYGKLRASLGATRGVHTPTEVVKYLMAGADVVMTTSALLKNGVDYMTTLRDGLQAWMEMHNYSSVAQMKGSMSQHNVADPTAFERANYIKTLESYKGDYS